MSTEKSVPDVDVYEEDGVWNIYQPPREKSIEELLAVDVEDESLRRYKEALLGEAKAKRIIYG